MNVRTDPLGDAYWKLNTDQQILGAALRDDWVPLRDALEQAEKDGGTKSAKMDWQKLRVLDVMDARWSKTRWIVRRGPWWKQFYEQHGLAATSAGLAILKLREGLAEIFADVKIEPDQALRGEIFVEKMKLAEDRSKIAQLEKRLEGGNE